MGYTLLLARALIQFPRANNDLLMFAPSRNLAPLLVVTVPRSEPARSIRLIFPWVTSADKPAAQGFWLTYTCLSKSQNKHWERHYNRNSLQHIVYTNGGMYTCTLYNIS